MGPNFYKLMDGTHTCQNAPFSNHHMTSYLCIVADDAIVTYNPDKLKVKEVPISTVYSESCQDLDQKAFTNIINHCLKIMRKESIRCWLADILRWRNPSTQLLKLSLKSNSSIINLDRSKIFEE